MNINDKKLIDKTNTVLLVGSFNNQQILNEINITKRNAEVKMLTSSPDNWKKIIREINHAKKDGKPIFVNFSEAILLISCNEEYRALFTKLLDVLIGSQHILFLYQDAFIGKYNIFNKPFYTKYLIYNWSRSIRDFSRDERIVAHKDSVVKTYFEIVDYYCSEILSKLSTPLDSEQQKCIISHISHCFDCNFNRSQLSIYEHEHLGEITIENFIKSPYYENAIFLSRHLVMLSIATDEREIDYRMSVLIPKPISDEEKSTVKSLFEADPGEDSLPFFREVNDVIIYDVIEKEREYERCEGFNIKRKTKPSENLFFEYWLKKFIVEKNTDVANTVKDLTNAVEQIKERNLNIVPYLHSVELISAIRDFFSEVERETVYTRYIYKDQLFAFELERFLTLFQDYITKVKGISIVFEEKRTEIGIVYMLKSTDKNVSKYNISEYVQEFAAYLDKCDNNVDFAKSMLSNEFLTDAQCEALALRFQKEAMRLKKDIIQDAERKMMNLRHQFENISIEMAIDVLPAQYDLTTALSEKPVTNLLQIDNKGIVNIQHIYGSASFNENDKQLFDIIEKYADNNQELLDAVKILKDKDAPKENKNDSSTKLKKFLATTASKIGDVGFKLLTKYLETQLFGS
jgi:hypothetical protein